MWELDHKEGWAPKNWCLWIVVLKTLESPLDCKGIKPVNLKGNQSEYSLQKLMLKLQYFGHLMRRANSLEKTLTLGKMEGKRRSGWQRMEWWDSITNPIHMKLNKLQEVGGQRSLVLQSMGLQRVGHNLATEPQCRWQFNGIYYVPEKWKWSRSVVSNSLWPRGL